MAAASTTTPRRGFFAAYRQGFNFWSLMPLLAIAMFAIFLIYPLVRMFTESLVGTDSDVFGVYVELFTKAYYFESLLTSFGISIVVTLAAGVIGVLLAYLVYRFNVSGKIVVRAAVVLTLVSPPFIGAYSWILLFGANGILRKSLASIGVDLPSIVGVPGMLIVLTLQGLPFVFLMTSAALSSVDQSVEDASINLGRSRTGTFFRAILPLLRGGISTGMLLVFVTAFSDFGTPSIIGKNVRVFPTLVYNSYINEAQGADFSRAASLSVILLVICLGALLIQRSYAKRNAFGVTAVTPLAPKALSGWKRVLVNAIVYAIIVIAVLPLLTVIVTSFLKTEFQRFTWNFTLDGYTTDASLLPSLGNTLLFTTIATILCTIAGCLVGYVIARRKTRLGGAIDLLSMVPYAVAGVVFGIAFSMGFGNSPFFLAGTGLILVLAYFMRRLPYSIRSVSSLLSQLGTSAEEASVNLGVAPSRTFWRITLPMVLPAVASGALLTWATVIREFNATAILYGSQTATMTVQVFSNVSYGRYENASAMGTILIVVSLIPVVLLMTAFGKDEKILV
ncbi:ABC transporter permease [Microbacterium caowuchunii]|uniref:Iron ABC transporter permease n=1 Tax=Microbacterium caowuchunii TaxID=2614638 RepID=A0A5N0TIH4_9MICO|nr:iron ABC transporter permease [Microbacterium caowuchunii]KAA9134401.1 iron ABC transporter permease [Microbacterium caowuchunii]